MLDFKDLTNLLTVSSRMICGFSYPPLFSCEPFPIRVSYADFTDRKEKKRKEKENENKLL